MQYANLDELHALASPRTDSPLELSFLLITQVKELLFRMLYVELDAARTLVRDDDVTAACRALVRANRVQGVLLTSWDTLTGMSATEFVEFRPILGEASGLQSFMYRALEYIMGNRDPASLERFREYGPIHPILEAEAATPSLYDEAVAYLDRNVRPVTTGTRARDVSSQYVASQDVEAAWLAVYREPMRYAAGHALAEALMEVSFQFSQWRATHLLVVERMLGSKPGTGGTEGTGWLRHINDHRFFPELWSVRTQL